MITNIIFELNMHLTNGDFTNFVKWKQPHLSSVANKEDEYLDFSMYEKGMMVIFRDSSYKKKVTLILDTGKELLSSENAPEKVCHKIRKRITKYFDGAYSLDDFCLKKASIICDFDIGSRESVCSYMRVIKRIRMVKGYSPANYFETDEQTSFCLEGNSNGICFMLYALEERMRHYHTGSRQYAGIIRSEVHLAKQKTIADITGAPEPLSQIKDIVNEAEAIFHSIFSQIIPPGNYYKKSTACEIVQKSVKKESLKRKMLKLIRLIPEKKSLLLAQKALDCRHIDEVMEEFKRINVSPITISKRATPQMLESISF